MAGEADRLVKNLDKKIKQGELYDAHQLVRAIFDRYVKTAKVDEGLEFAEKYADRFSEEGAFELTANLGQRSLQLLQSTNAVPTPELLDRLSLFFLLCPPGSTDYKYQYMDALIKWSKAGAYEDPDEKKRGSRHLHLLMAEAYLAEQNFGAAQGHALVTKNTDLITRLLAEWKSNVYPSEQAMIEARAIIILLALNDVQTAGEILNNMTGVDWDTTNVAPPLQLAYLLWVACQEKNEKLLDFVTRKYALVIRMDKSFDKGISAIESYVFGIRKQPSDLMGMLSSMFAQPAGQA